MRPRGRLPTQESIGRPFAAATFTAASLGVPSATGADVACRVTPHIGSSSRGGFRLRRHSGQFLPQSAGRP